MKNRKIEIMIPSDYFQEKINQYNKTLVNLSEIKSTYADKIRLESKEAHTNSIRKF